MLGLINPAHHSGFLTPAQAEEHCAREDEVLLELKPGDVSAVQNPPSSILGVNESSAHARARALCVCPSHIDTYSLGRGAVVGGVAPQLHAAQERPELFAQPAARVLGQLHRRQHPDQCGGAGGQLVGRSAEAGPFVAGGGGALRGR
jgi:hypothetical protein